MECYKPIKLKHIYSTYANGFYPLMKML